MYHPPKNQEDHQRSTRYVSLPAIMISFVTLFLLPYQFFFSHHLQFNMKSANLTRFYPSCLAGLLCCCPKRKLFLTAQGPRYDWGGHHFWKSDAVVIESPNSRTHYKWRMTLLRSDFFNQNDSRGKYRHFQVKMTINFTPIDDLIKKGRRMKKRQYLYHH